MPPLVIVLTLGGLLTGIPGVMSLAGAADDASACYVLWDVVD